MSVQFIITTAGRAALVNAANTGTASVVLAAVGLSASAVTPSASATSLPGEFKRVTTVGGQLVAADIIHVTMTDASTDIYSVKSFALYLNDGTLFGIYGQTDVIVTKAAGAECLLSFDLQFADSSAASITFGPTDWVNPPASETVWGVVKLATLAIAKAGADALTVLTPATAKASLLNWLGYTPANRAGDTFTGTVYTPNMVVSGAGGGGASLTLGDAGHTGVLSFTDTAGARRGYAGFIAAGGAVQYGNDGGGGHAFNGGTLTRDGNRIHDTGTDGAGSDNDAGLFWGQTPDYYTNIPARLGYPPARGQTDLGNVDLNTATISGMYRVNIPSNGPAGVSYGQLLVVQGGGDTITQLYSSYSDGVLWTRSGNPANTGGVGGWSPWTSLVRATTPQVYSAADVIAKLLTVDGAGSTLDSDYLRGLPPEYFTDILGRLGWTPVRQGGGAGQLFNTVYIGWSGSRVKIQVDGADQGNLMTDYFAGAGVTGFNGTAMRRNGWDLYGPDNDGAGSPVDAGVFCGHDISEFALKAGTVGYYQSAQEVTTARGWGQNYVNNTGRPIHVYINVDYRAGGSNIWLVYVDGVEVGYNSGNSSTNTTGSLSAFVPAGSTYSANVATGNVSLRSWTEVR